MDVLNYLTFKQEEKVQYFHNNIAKFRFILEILTKMVTEKVYIKLEKNKSMYLT